MTCSTCSETVSLPRGEFDANMVWSKDHFLDKVHDAIKLTICASPVLEMVYGVLSILQGGILWHARHHGSTLLVLVVLLVFMCIR